MQQTRGRWRRWLGLGGALAACSWLGCGAPSRPLPQEAASIPWTAEEVRLIDQPGEIVARLGNGLTVIVTEVRWAPVAAVRLYVRAGSIYEEGHYGAGLSHLFEHLLACGATPTRTEQQSLELLQQIGGHWNAYTSQDRTCYFITAPAAHAGAALNLMADWITRPTFPQASFEREWGVVQRELEMSATDPDHVQANLFDELRYQVHPARFPVIGYQAILRQTTRREILDYYQRRYVPDNTVLAVAGDFNAEQMLGAVRKEFGDFARRPVPVANLPEEPPVTSARELVKVLPTLQGPARLMMGFASVSLRHPDLYALDALATVLGEGDSSRLYRSLVERRQLALAIGAVSETPAYAPGTFTIAAELPLENIAAARQAVLEELERVRREPVGADELDRAKKQLEVAHLRRQQTAEQTAASRGEDFLATGDPHFSEHYLKGIRRLTVEQLQDAAQRYLLPEKQLTLVLAGKPLPAAQEAAAAPAPGEFTKVTLDNGLRVLLQRRPAVALVDVQLYILGGLLEESDATNGLTTLMADLSTKGAAQYSAEQIADYFDGVGGELATVAGNNSFFYTCQVRPDDLPRALDLFSAIVLQPTFPPDQLERLKPQVLAAIDELDDSWFAQAERFFRSRFYTASPYRRSAAGGREAVQKATPDDLRQFHRQAVVASRAVLAVVGDIDPAAAETLMRQRFGGLPAGAPLDLKLLPVDAPADRPRVFVQSSPRPGATVYVGYPGGALTDPAQRYPLEVLNEMIGGTSTPDWFFGRLRGAQLVYYARGYNFLGVLPGYLAASAQCDAEKVPEVVRIMQELFARAERGELSEDQLARAKSSLINAESLRHQTNAQIAQQAALDELYGLGYDWSRGQAERIQAVTLQDVQNAARRHLARPPTITIITSRPELAENLVSQPAPVRR